MILAPCSCGSCGTIFSVQQRTVLDEAFVKSWIPPHVTLRGVAGVSQRMDLRSWNPVWALICPIEKLKGSPSSERWLKWPLFVLTIITFTTFLRTSSCCIFFNVCPSPTLSFLDKSLTFTYKICLYKSALNVFLGHLTEDTQNGSSNTCTKC